MRRRSTIPTPLLWAAIIAFFSSFLFPGLRIAGVPISIASLVALAFLPVASRGYDRPRWLTVVVAMIIIVFLAIFNAVLFGFEMRNILYLLIPLGAIGTVGLVKEIADNYGMPRLQRWALWLCIINIFIMVLQAFNVGGINENFSILWNASIEYVATNDHEREILQLTLPIRPPGFFPTGIFASTAIYIICRGIFIYQRKTWPLLLALMAILISTNRTLAVIFIIYESVAVASVMGLRRFFTRALSVILLSVLTVTVASQAGMDLYLLKFLTEELGDGFEATASVVERLKTFEIFVANLPRHGLTGGFSSSALAGEEHVFDSELMLRTLQFGIFGVICLALVILVPRKGERTGSWAFLLVLGFLASLTTTLTTSVVYAVAIAFYKESIVRANGNVPLPRPTARYRKQRRRTVRGDSDSAKVLGAGNKMSPLGSEAAA